MPGAPSPQTLLEAIAADASSGLITAPMPETPTGTNAASVQGGFPAITMQNELSGGKPPFGQDMNGFLFLITSHTLWVECGQLYTFNATLASAINGYLAGTVLGMADGTGMWLCVINGNTNNPDTGGAGWVPLATYGSQSVPVTGGVVTLTAAQSKFGVIIFTGTLTSNLIVNFPQTTQEWLVINRTSGSFTTTVQTAAGGSSGVTIPQGGFVSPVGIYSIGDGNIYPTVAPLSVPIDQNPNPLTLVERTNAGYVLATYLNQNSPFETFPISGVMYVSSIDNNFLRKMTLANFEANLLLQALGGQVSNGQVPFSAVSQWASALFASAVLTGVPTAPTAGLGTSSAQIATTAFANPGVTVNSNGVGIRLANGYKIQFGTINPAGGTATITFPIPFTSSVFGPWGINISGGATQAWLPSAPGLSTAQISNSGGSTFWIATGI